MPVIEIPRRARIDLFTPAEKAIRDALLAVEAAGCDERLTKAVTLLDDAREWVADFVDGVAPEDHYPRSAPARMLTLIVNGQNVDVPIHPGDRIAVVALSALLAEGYGWTMVELRDFDGHRIEPGRLACEVAGPVYVSQPVGWVG
jgi:hypothetical protein